MPTGTGATVDGVRMAQHRREGSLEAPQRHPIPWQDPQWYDQDALNAELERVFNICHGCRRCFNLCEAFPTLFDLVDGSDTMEIDGVAKADYMKVVDQCYLCDMCFMTKCPYVPPHEWNVDFPKLMLRAKAVNFRNGKVSRQRRRLSNTDRMGKLTSLPGVVKLVNTLNANSTARGVMEKTLGIHRDAALPPIDPQRAPVVWDGAAAEPGKGTTGKLAIFATCYCRYNEPGIVDDLAAVLKHNQVPFRQVADERCCGMPHTETGDLESVARAREHNIPRLVKLVDEGWDLTAPVPSCVLMFKQDLPLMYPDDRDVKKVAEAYYDPFEYLLLRHAAGKLKTDFVKELGTVSYQVACHQRVQNIGLKTRAALNLVPGTQVVPVDRCSGHDGTYGVRVETYPIARKISRPVIKRMQQAQADHYSSDCPLAGRHLAAGMDSPDAKAEHPISLFRYAYGL